MWNFFIIWRQNTKHLFFKTHEENGLVLIRPLVCWIFLWLFKCVEVDEKIRVNLQIWSCLMQKGVGAGGSRYSSEITWPSRVSYKIFILLGDVASYWLSLKAIFRWVPGPFYLGKWIHGPSSIQQYVESILRLKRYISVRRIWLISSELVCILTLAKRILMLWAISPLS